MASDRIVAINDSNWQSEVLDSDVPVLVDFWAEWCGPCRAIAPTLDILAEENKDKLKIAKVNVDDNQSLAAKYNVRSIPNLLVFKGGEVVEQMVGAMSKPQFEEKLAAHIG